MCGEVKSAFLVPVPDRQLWIAALRKILAATITMFPTKTQCDTAIPRKQLRAACTVQAARHRSIYLTVVIVFFSIAMHLAPEAGHSPCAAASLSP